MSKIHKSPQYGTTNPEKPESQSQPDGTAANDARGETQAQPSGPHGGNPATAGKSAAPVNSQTPEKRESQINPSATTQGTEFNAEPHASTPGAPLNDTFGEAGDPHGRGNLQVPDQTVDSRDSSGKSQQANFVGNPPTEDTPGTEGAGDLRHREDEEAA